MMFQNNNEKFRLSDGLKKDMRRAVDKRPGTYTSVSHFIRIAIVRELRRFRK